MTIAKFAVESLYRKALRMQSEEDRTADSDGQ